MNAAGFAISWTSFPRAETNVRWLTLSSMEGRPDERVLLRRAMCARINTQLRSQYEAVLGEKIPERFVDLLSQLNQTDIPEKKGRGTQCKGRGGVRWPALDDTYTDDRRALPWRERINWHGLAFFAVVLVLLIAALTW